MGNDVTFAFDTPHETANGGLSYSVNAAPKATSEGQLDYLRAKRVAGKAQRGQPSLLDEY